MWKVLSFLQMLLINYWLEFLVFGGCGLLILLGHPPR